LWVDDNRGGLACGEVVDVVEPGVQETRGEDGSGKLRLGEFDSPFTRKGNERLDTQVT